MNTLHTPSSMITRYCAPPIINPEPKTITVMSRCHKYEGEWEPERDSLYGWLQKNGYRMVGTRIIPPGRSTVHLDGCRSCPAVCQAINGDLQIIAKTRAEFDRLEPNERCKHCQNAIEG